MEKCVVMKHDHTLSIGRKKKKDHKGFRKRLTLVGGA